jgi:hypothetical protein
MMFILGNTESHRRSCAVLLLLSSGCLGVDALAGDVTWQGGVTAVVQQADDSRTETDATASADLFAKLAMGRGEWLVYIEASTTPKSDGVSAFYPTANGDAGSVLASDGSGGVQVSEFNYTLRTEDNHSLMMGLVDPSAWLDRGRIANDENQNFLNGSFINNATIEFPDYALGAIYRAPAKGRRPEVTAVVSGSDGIADLPERSYQDLLDFNGEGRGLFVGTGAHWRVDSSSWRLGAWFRTDDHTVAGSTVEEERNYGIYGVYGREYGANALNFRAGQANDDVSVASNFVAVAYQRKLARGLFGIGAARTGISSGFQTGERDNAFDAEVYFRIPIAGDAGHVTSSIQYIEAPGIDAPEFAPSSNAVIAGVRFHYSFQENR